MKKILKYAYFAGVFCIAVAFGLGFVIKDMPKDHLATKFPSLTLQELLNTSPAEPAQGPMSKLAAAKTNVDTNAAGSAGSNPDPLTNGYAPKAPEHADFKQALTDADVHRVAIAVAEELSRQGFVANELKRDPEIVATALVIWARQNQGDAPEIKKDDINPGLVLKAQDTTDGVVVGDPNASFTAVAFLDPNCPHCRETIPAALAWVDRTPGVRILFRDLPVIAPQSMDASRVAMALGQQGLYRKWLEALPDWQGSVIDLTVAKDIAKHIGANMDELEVALKSPAITKAITENLTLGSSLNIDGTPAWVIGNKLAIGSLTVNWLIDFAGQQGAPLPPNAGNPALPKIGDGEPAGTPQGPLSSPIPAGSLPAK